jgi:TRAP-type C4-dicarboxylate transport system permease large subunit
MIRGRLSWKGFRGAAVQTMSTTGMIFFIVIGASVLMSFIALSNIPTWLSGAVGGLPLPPLAIMGMIILVYMVLGCIMDTLIMLLLTIPIFFPLAENLGFDPIWFGVIVVAVAEIGLITPPIGMNLFVIAGMTPDIPMQTIMRGVFPFVVADFCRLAIYVFFPAVALFLPSLR